MCFLVLNPSVKLEWFKINEPSFLVEARMILVNAVSLYFYQANFINNIL
jgi:hypothetical protein